MVPVRLWRSYYSNVKLGRRKTQNQDEWILCILEPVESLRVERREGSTKEYRKNWARLIRLRWIDPENLPC